MRYLSNTGRSTTLVVFVAGMMLPATRAFGEKDLSPAKHVARANKALAVGSFEQALDDYRQVEVVMPDAPELAYDQAIAYYRMRDLGKARDLFSKALATRDLGLEAKIKFNLGNCEYAEALEKLSNLQEAIDKLRAAIAYYRDALDLAPEDTDARANIETAQLLIKDLLDKLKKQQEQQQKNPTSQSCDNPQKQDQQQQSGQEQPPQSQPSDQQQGQQDQPKEQEGEKQPQEQTGEDQQQQEQQQTGKEEKRQLTQEEAQRLLQAVRDKEQKRRDERARRQRLGRAKVDKDW